MSKRRWRTRAELEHEHAVAKIMHKATDAKTEPARGVRREANQRRDRRIKRHLTSGEVRAEMAWTTEERDVFNLIAKGKPMRNAGVVLNALKIKLDQYLGAPKQNVEHSGGVQVIVQTLAKPAAPEALPEVVDAEKPALEGG